MEGRSGRRAPADEWIGNLDNRRVLRFAGALASIWKALRRDDEKRIKFPGFSLRVDGLDF